jgi:type IV secretory pathway VirB2 component (pilin)
MKTLNNNFVNKRILLVFFLFFVITAFSFADNDDFGMNDKVGIIIKFITSPWVKGIAFIALVIECIAMIFAGRQEPGMFKKFIPWIAGTIIFMAAGHITSAFLKLDTSGTIDTLFK